MGIFNVGAWGHHTAVDLRFRPSMTALRVSQLVRRHLRALTHFDGSPVKVWVPLSQGEMSRKGRPRARAAVGGRNLGGLRALPECPSHIFLDRNIRGTAKGKGKGKGKARARTREGGREGPGQGMQR